MALLVQGEQWVLEVEQQQQELDHVVAQVVGHEQVQTLLQA